MSGIFDETRLMSAEEVAEVLGVKPRTIFSWVTQNRIPYIKLGEGRKSLVKFNPKRLNQWLEEQSNEPKQTENSLKKREKSRKARRKTIERFNEFAASI
ncbi:MAG: helix-turn-helix domain-containing protein [Candidatus Aminicenantes bacterium]